MLSLGMAVNRNLLLGREDDNKDCFENSATGVMHLDNSLYIKNINPEAEKICGVNRLEVVGRRADYVFSNFGKEFLRIFTISDGDDFQTSSFKAKIFDRYVFLHADTLKIRDAAGKLCGIIVILQDISAIRVAVKQIQTTQLLMSLGELAAGVAHHVRTPLTTISGYLQVMLNRLEDDGYMVRREVLETMLDEVSYINDVVKELIMFAKPPIKKESQVDINKLLEEALLLSFRQLGGEKINIIKNIAANLPLVDVDPNLIKQAMVNIIQNAIEAMPDQGLITVKTWFNSELNMVVAAIYDTGGGIAPDLLPRIFEPFYTTKLDRMGLGLPIAYRILSEHGGFINISGDENQGTKVHMYIPILDDRGKQLGRIHQQILNLQ